MRRIVTRPLGSSCSWSCRRWRSASPGRSSPRGFRASCRSPSSTRTTPPLAAARPDDRRDDDDARGGATRRPEGGRGARSSRAASTPRPRPGGLERDVKRGQAEPVVAYTNAQLLVPASIVKRDLRPRRHALGGDRAPAPASCRRDGGERRRPLRAGPRGHPRPLQPRARLRLLPRPGPRPDAPPRLRPRGRGPLPGLELRDGTAGEWLETAGGSVTRALAGKLLPSTVAFLAVAAWPWASCSGSSACPCAGARAPAPRHAPLRPRLPGDGPPHRRALRQPALRLERRRVPRRPRLRLHRHHLPHVRDAGLARPGGRCCR